MEVAQHVQVLPMHVIVNSGCCICVFEITTVESGKVLSSVKLLARTLFGPDYEKAQACFKKAVRDRRAS